MVDLGSQLEHIKKDVDQAIQGVLTRSDFIKGKDVPLFEEELAKWTHVDHVISCANGTDALQLAFMALGLKPGDEVLVPTFTYVATAEVIALLGLKPLLIDVHADTFGVDLHKAEALITPNTKAIVPVHLYGQCSDMEAVLELASKHNLFVIEDTAQAIGAKYTFKDGTVKYAGTMGDIGTTSFFPSKNLGCYGDGGALFTNNAELAHKLRMIANHGQKVKYHHDVIGVNSRLDTLQAAILRVKLPHLGTYIDSRQKSAAYYDQNLGELDAIVTPVRDENSTHVFHQYTMRVLPPFSREALKAHLSDHGIPSMIYYPLPLHKQKAFLEYVEENASYEVSEMLCEQVLSLPIHTEQTEEELDFIVSKVKEFFS